MPDPLPDPLPLGRAVVDRDAASRAEAGLLERLRADPAARALLVSGPELAVRPGAEPTLLLVPPAQLDPQGELAYLGRDGDAAYVSWTPPDGVSLATAVAALADDDHEPAADADADVDAEIVTLRDAGHLLDARDAGLATCAVALAQWRRTHTHCPRCGAEVEVAEAGWSTRCPADGSSHYPRTDPAVIMAVHDAADRLLLARSVAWPERRRSVLAGFVEAGEGLEAAVRREVAEEVGLEVGPVAYAGAQPWPFPASLMVGFHAWVVGPDGEPADSPTPDGVEITHAEWYSRQELRGAVASGAVGLPMRTSIARALIEAWYGSELPD